MIPSSPPSKKTPWTRGNILGVAGLVLTILGLILALTQPEIRRLIGLDHSSCGSTNPSSEPTPTHVPAGFITEFPIPTVGSDPEGITAGPDGNLWFTEVGDNGNKIGRISPSGAITEFPIPTVGSDPEGIPTVGSDPEGITAGPDGNLWFTEKLGNKIGRISPSGAITEFPIPTPTVNGDPEGITAGPDGNLWFTVNLKIGRITTPNGAITEFPLPTDGSFPKGITAGPDGNLWFTEYYGNMSDRIERISPSGAITEFPLPTVKGTPEGITAGPDGNLWFTEYYGNKIGRISSGR